MTRRLIFLLEHSLLIAVTDLAETIVNGSFLTVYQGLVDTGDGASIEMAGGFLLYMAIIRRVSKITRLCVEG